MVDIAQNKNKRRKKSTPTAEEIAMKRAEMDFYDLEVKLKKSYDFSKTILITNIPNAKPSQMNKLKKKLKKGLCPYGTIVKHGMQLPLDPMGNALGVCFVTFSTTSAAFMALNYSKFDRKIRVKVFRVENLMNCAKNLKNNASDSKKLEKAMGNSDSKVSSRIDGHFRSQFVIRAMKETIVFWNDPLWKSKKGMDEFTSYSMDIQNNYWKSSGVPILSEKILTTSYVLWSPQGTYLAFVNKPVLHLYTGTPLQSIAEFHVKNCTFFTFSPRESFLITAAVKKARKEISIWRIATREIIMKFDADELFEQNTPINYIKWSFDEKYFARSIGDKLYVYDSETCLILPSFSNMEVQGLHSFSFSPHKNLLAMVAISPSHNSRSMIRIFSLPDCKESYTRIYEGEITCSLYWRRHFVATFVSLFDKKKEFQKCYFDFFFIDYPLRSIPKESLNPLEMEKGTPSVRVSSYKFSPSGEFLALLKTTESDKPRDLAVFKVKDETILPVFALEKMNANHLFWGPKSDTLVVTGLNLASNGFTGQLRFYDTKFCHLSEEFAHIGFNFGQWSPCGRYFATAKTQAVSSSSTKVIIWSRRGEKLVQTNVNGLYQFQWRPLPALEVDEKEKVEVAKKMEKEFEAMDAAVKRLNLGEKEQRAMESILMYKEMKKILFEMAERNEEEMRKLRDGLLEEEEMGEMEFEVEEVLEEKIEKVK